MNTLGKLFDYSQLSMAAYSTKIQTQSFEAALQDKDSSNFTSDQAHQFIEDGWTVVEQSSDTLYGDSSFSATLFRNSKTGESMFAHHQLDDLK